MTSVEWLWEQIPYEFTSNRSAFEVFEQAKEMEAKQRQQLVDDAITNYEKGWADKKAYSQTTSDEIINELESLVKDNSLGVSYRAGITDSIWRIKEWFETYGSKGSETKQ